MYYGLFQGDTDDYDQIIGNMHHNVRLVPDEVAMLVVSSSHLNKSNY